MWLQLIKELINQHLIGTTHKLWRTHAIVTMASFFLFGNPEALSSGLFILKILGIFYL